MIAFIFNSGSGNRLKPLTDDKPKAFVELANGETIISRQLRLLKRAGIRRVVISIGPYPELWQTLVEKHKDLDIILVPNPRYSETNNIYSLHLAREHLDKDCLVLHGDLVFDLKILEVMLNHKQKNLSLINTQVDKPEKDFKGVIVEGLLNEISVHAFGDNAYALQPIYKCSTEMMSLWLKACDEFVNTKKVNHYAEDALNLVMREHPISVYDYKNHFIEEIDTMEDFEYVSSEIKLRDYNDQLIMKTDNLICDISSMLQQMKISKPFIVHGKHLMSNREIMRWLEKHSNRFSDYSPNPTFEEVLEGLKHFKETDCDGIVAIGGGSCLDTAKAIKWYSEGNYDDNNVKTKSHYINLPLIAIPTTAGTGSEATHFAVIYVKGEKQSLAHDCLLPEAAFLSTSLLKDLPVYQRKVTVLDALCQAIESFWSINATIESRKFASQAIDLILNHYEEYIAGSNKDLDHIMKASHLAGKAINLTKTTAPHALSYKLSSLYGIAHGHAVAITLPYVYEKTLEKIDDQQSAHDLNHTMNTLAVKLGVPDKESLIVRLTDIIDSFDLKPPIFKSKHVDLLVNSVNVERLLNHPVSLSEEDIKQIYFKSLMIKSQKFNA